MRMVDQWMLANLITMFATTVTMTITWQWHEANRRAARTEAGAVLTILRINVFLSRAWFAINAGVWLLGGWLVLVAHGIDVRASAAHPARVETWVVQGTAWFALFWVAGCAASIVAKGRLDRLAATAEPAAPLRVVAPGTRREKGGQ